MRGSLFRAYRDVEAEPRHGVVVLAVPAEREDKPLESGGNRHALRSKVREEAVKLFGCGSGIDRTNVMPYVEVVREELFEASSNIVYGICFAADHVEVDPHRPFEHVGEVLPFFDRVNRDQDVALTKAPKLFLVR